MTHEEALKDAEDFQYLVGKTFLLANGENESVKAVIAWNEGDENWQTHVCFYDWDESNADGEITHLPVNEFLAKYVIS